MMLKLRSITGARSQTGMTLIELVVAMGVGSIILGAAGSTLWQVWDNNMRNTRHLLAVKQVENAMHFLVRDAQMAQTVETTGLGPGEVLRLAWVGWDGSSEETVYSWDATKHLLTRTHSVDGSSTVVEYSADPQPTFSVVNKQLLVSLTCTVQGTQETRVAQITPRTGS
jgi:prepilin-type N-terminal cleavage/methylation domain-containing protein